MKTRRRSSWEASSRRAPASRARSTSGRERLGRAGARRRGPPGGAKAASSQAVWERKSVDAVVRGLVASRARSAAHGSCSSSAAEEAATSAGRRALDHERRDHVRPWRRPGGRCCRRRRRSRRPAPASRRRGPRARTARRRRRACGRASRRRSATTHAGMAIPLAYRERPFRPRQEIRHARLRSRTVTHGRNMAGARALLRAAGRRDGGLRQADHRGRQQLHAVRPRPHAPQAGRRDRRGRRSTRRAASRASSTRSRSTTASRWATAACSTRCPRAT